MFSYCVFLFNIRERARATERNKEKKILRKKVAAEGEGKGSLQLRAAAGQVCSKPGSAWKARVRGRWGPSLSLG